MIPNFEKPVQKYYVLFFRCMFGKNQYFLPNPQYVLPNITTKQDCLLPPSKVLIACASFLIESKSLSVCDRMFQRCGSVLLVLHLNLLKSTFSINKASIETWLDVTHGLFSHVKWFLKREWAVLPPGSSNALVTADAI